jgi:transcriptional regulator with XRE-family HTH domain
MTIANRIRDYITTNGILLKKVAERSGIEQKKFYRLVNGKTGMSVEEYEAICKRGLGVDPSYFFKDSFSKIEKGKTA